MSEKKELRCPRCDALLESVEIVPYLGSDTKYLLCSFCGLVLRLTPDGQIEVTEIKVLDSVSDD